jgi:predicted lipoprotein with Yx(FWY)xxD motif
MHHIVACLAAGIANLIVAAAWGDPPVDATSGQALVAGLTSHKTIFGDTIADANGMTLYTFDGDERGKSACVGACTDSWQAFAAPRLAKPVGDWSAISRDDGVRQWAYKGKPLYRFTADLGPGDVNGDGVDGRWHAAIGARSFLPPGVAVRPTEYGPAFATGDGKTLYMLVNFFYIAAANGTPRHQSSPPPSACAGECAKVWQPLIAPADAKPAGDWTMVARDDGAQQWAWKNHPLYSYAGDVKPGDASGEGNWTYIGNIGTHWEVANITQ